MGVYSPNTLEKTLLNTQGHTLAKQGLRCTGSRLTKVGTSFLEPWLTQRYAIQQSLISTCVAMQGFRAQADQLTTMFCMTRMGSLPMGYSRSRTTYATYTLAALALYLLFLQPTTLTWRRSVHGIMTSRWRAPTAPRSSALGAGRQPELLALLWRTAGSPRSRRTSRTSCSTAELAVVGKFMGLLVLVVLLLN